MESATLLAAPVAPGPQPRTSVPRLGVLTAVFVVAIAAVLAVGVNTDVVDLLWVGALPQSTSVVPARSPLQAAPTTVDTAGEPTLQERIASFYDQTSLLWEEEWGEHMHHGFYQPGVPIKDHAQNIAAQEHMVDEILKYGQAHELKGPLRILDAGCGIGGSARYLARKFPEARVTGITLSPFQQQRAVALTAAAGLSDRVDFIVMDAMHTQFGANTFDLVYSMESGEHMPDKRGFVQECHRVLKPNAPLVMAVWCHREVPPELDASEIKLLHKIYKVYALPYVCPLSDFTVFAKELAMRDVRHDDWTRYIRPFWWQVIKRAVSPSGVWGLIKSGWTAIHGAWAAWWMHLAVERQVFVFGAFTARKTKA